MAHLLSNAEGFHSVLGKILEDLLDFFSNEKCPKLTYNITNKVTNQPHLRFV